MHLPERPPEELSSKTWRTLLDAINGGLGAENFAGRVIAVTTAAANTEFVVDHSLFRVPSYFLVLRSDKGGVVYDSGTPWTKRQIFLKCSTATTVLTLLVL